MRNLARIWVGVLCAALTSCSSPPQPTGDLPLRRVGETALTGGAVRFDYMGLDADRSRLFIAHMGAGEVIEVDLRTKAVVRTVPGLRDVHGVIAVPSEHRIYATATGANQLVALDENTGQEVFRAPTGTYPDGLAYDPIRRTVWTTNESAGTETVIDADTGAVRATVTLGGEVGNVVYDSFLDQMVVAVQGRNELALVDPDAHTVTDRIPTPDCDHPHGQALDEADQVMFVGCENNATMITIDLVNRTVVDHQKVGETPDVLVNDATNHRVYIAAESGWVNVFDHDRGHLTPRGSAHLADGAHTLALNPNNHHTYFPIPNGPNGSPILWEFEPTT